MKRTPPPKLGDEFDRLTIRRLWMAQKGKQNAMRAFCECKCGGTTEQWVAQLKIGRVRSCGCLLSEKSRERTTKRNTTHGMSKHGLYSQYHAMMNRCYRPEVISYKDYGGRGITVCNTWKNSFEKFAEWALDNGWEKGLTIDRINNDQGYSPDNCRWSTVQEQQNNRRSNLRMTAFGETKTLSNWSRDSRCIVSYYVLYDRIHKLGWSLEDALTKPCRKMT